MTSTLEFYKIVVGAGRRMGWVFESLPDTATEAELESASREMVRGMFWGMVGFDENDIRGSFDRRLSRRVMRG